MRKLLPLIALLLLAACSPSLLAQPTATPTPQPTVTPTPQPTVTPTSQPTEDPRLDYISEYNIHLQAWLKNFERVQQNNKRIAAEGAGILQNETFRAEITASLSDFEQSAKSMAQIEPPVTELQWYQDKAEELHAHTEMFTNLYPLALIGDSASLNVAMDSLQKASQVWTEIIDRLNSLLDEMLANR